MGLGGVLWCGGTSNQTGAQGRTTSARARATQPLGQPTNDREEAPCCTHRHRNGVSYPLRGGERGWEGDDGGDSANGKCDKKKIKKKCRREQKTHESPPPTAKFHRRAHVQGEGGRVWVGGWGLAEAEVGVAAGVHMGFESVKHEERRQEECWTERKKKQVNRKEKTTTMNPRLSTVPPSSLSPLPLNLLPSFTDFVPCTRAPLLPSSFAFLLSSAVVLQRRLRQALFFPTEEGEGGEGEWGEGEGL